MALGVAEIAGGAVGGAIVQSILAPLIAQRGQRRDVRAAVLQRLSDVESGRWAPNLEWSEFRAAIAALKSAALVASIPRELVDRYTTAARVARMSSWESWQDYGGDEEAGAGGIDGALSELSSDAASLMVAYTWHPLRRRIVLRRDLKRLDSQRDGLLEDKPGYTTTFEYHGRQPI